MKKVVFSFSPPTMNVGIPRILVRSLRFVLTAASVFHFSLLVAQTPRIDSLKQVVRNASLPDTVKLEALDELTRSYMHINPDSGKRLAQQVIDLGTKLNNKYWIARGANEIGIYCEDQGNIADALVSYDRSMKLFQEVGDKKGMCSELTNMGNLCEVQGNYNGALVYYNRVLKLSEEVGNKYSMADAYGNIGLVNEDQGNYPEALKNFNKSISIEKETGDEQGEFTNLVDIGVVYQDQSNYPEALSYYLQGLSIAEKLGQKEEVCAIYVNVANVYQEQGNYVEALNNDEQCLVVAKHMGNKKIMAAAYGDIGNNYKLMGKYAEALKNQQFSLNVDEEMGFPSGMCSAYSNMGNIYDAEHDYPKAIDAFHKSLAIAEKIGDKSSMCLNYSLLGSALMNVKKVDQANAYLDSALALAQKIGSKDVVKNTYSYLTNMDSLKGDFSRAFNDFKLFVKYKDSLVNEANTRKIVSEQMNYEFERKQAAEQAEQDKKDLLNAADKQKQRTLTILVSLGLVIVLAFSLLLFNRFRTASRQKAIIEKQKALVERKNRDVVASITYAKRLQDAILPPISEVKRQLPESFILYKPKAIVAGDFYWMHNLPLPAGEGRGEVTLVAACDCTGHGVPGALVSVVCSNALDRAVKEFGLTDPGKILDKTRELVIETFSHKELFGGKSGGNIQDGMDISLASISFPSVIARNEAISEVDKRLPRPDDGSRSDVTVRLNWSGAYRPLWVISPPSAPGAEPVVKEVAADKQPVGKHHIEVPFSTHSLELKKGDSIYLFTDGFGDQFGGEKGKKFKYRQLQKLVVENVKLKMEEQKQLLEKAFTDWQGNLEQTDDVCVIGIRV